MRFIAIIRSIVWPAVFTVGFTVAAITVAFTVQGALSETIALSSAAIAFGLLAIRS